MLSILTNPLKSKRTDPDVRHVNQFEGYGPFNEVVHLALVDAVWESRSRLSGISERGGSYGLVYLSLVRCKSKAGFAATFFDYASAGFL
jgi:hypothetical protein